MRPHLIFLAITLTVLLVGAGCEKEALQTVPAPPPALGTSAHGLAQAHMTVGGKALIVELARTPMEKAQGLSGRAGLAEEAGMLFVFVPQVMPSFWMKDMKLSIDIIWIRDNRVVDISARLPYPPSPQAPASLPTYRPHEPIDFVLEVPEGWVDRHRIAQGVEAAVYGNQ
jgi:uncharacterized membrane protein (UPF0127 family)